MATGRTTPRRRQLFLPVSGLEGLVVEVVVIEALEVGLDHLSPSVVLGLKPPSPWRGLDGVGGVSPQIQREVRSAA